MFSWYCERCIMLTPGQVERPPSWFCGSEADNFRSGATRHSELIFPLKLTQSVVNQVGQEVLPVASGVIRQVDPYLPNFSPIPVSRTQPHFEVLPRLPHKERRANVEAFPARLRRACFRDHWPKPLVNTTAEHATNPQRIATTVNASIGGTSAVESDTETYWFIGSPSAPLNFRLVCNRANHTSTKKGVVHAYDWYSRLLFPFASLTSVKDIVFALA
jgi:hypothetical protein